jgi:hypothetical protein
VVRTKRVNYYPPAEALQFCTTAYAGGYDSRATLAFIKAAQPVEPLDVEAQALDRRGIGAGRRSGHRSRDTDDIGR